MVKKGWLNTPSFRERRQAVGINGRALETRYFQMLAEDGKHFADDTRKFMETGARFFSNGPAEAA